MKIKFLLGLIIFLLIFNIPSYAQLIRNQNIQVNKLRCIKPTSGVIITKDTNFCPGTYNLSEGISIGANNISLNCNNAFLIGNRELNITGISLFLKSNVEIKDCNIQRFGTGISLLESDKNVIRRNKIDGIGAISVGIKSLYSNYNLYSQNEIQNSFKGIDIYSIIGSNISKNRLINNSYGIYLDTGLNNNVVSNEIYYNNIGLFISDFVDNIVKSNSIINGNTGIILNEDVIDNIISYNVVEGEKIGILINKSVRNTITLNQVSKNVEGIHAFYSFLDLMSFNNIYNNSNFNFYNDLTNDIKAENNWWGAINITEIEDKIFDLKDDSSKGLVDYCPFLDAPYPSGNSTMC